MLLFNSLHYKNFIFQVNILSVYVQKQSCNYNQFYQIGKFKV